MGGERPDGGTSSGGSFATGGGLSGGSAPGGGVSSGATSGGVSSGGVLTSGGSSAATGGTASWGGQGGATLGITDPGSCAEPGSHEFWGFDSDQIHTGSDAQEGSWWLNPSDRDNSGTLEWTGSQGLSQLGALALQIDDPADPQDIQTLLPKVELALRDLSGAVVTAHVYLESGEDVLAKVYAQSGDPAGTYPWANGLEYPLVEGEWTCVAFDVSNPDFADGRFDPTNVSVLGIEVSRLDSPLTDTISVFVDDYSY